MPAMIGLGFDYVDLTPGLLDSLVERVGASISHLSIMAIRDERAAGAFRRTAQDIPIIHHLSNVAPANPHGPNFRTLQQQDRISQILDAVWCNEDIGSWDLGPYFLPSFSAPLFEDDVVSIVGERIEKMRQFLSVPFLPEIPACSFAAGRLSLGAFFTRLTLNTDSRLLVDLSHVYSYALAVDERPEDILSSLPLDRVWQLHVAGGFVMPDEPTFYIDSHTCVTPDPVISLLARAAESCKNLRAVTFEVVPTALSIDQIEAEIRRLGKVLERAGIRQLPINGPAAAHEISA